MTQIKYGLFLGAIGALCAVLIAATNNLTAPIIRYNQEASIREAIAVVFPEMGDFETLASVDNGDEIAEPTIQEIQQIFGHDGETLGYIFTQATSGFGGPMLYIIGLDATGHIEGFSVISHGETPGIGAFITYPEFQVELHGRSISEPIDIHSGATVTSTTIRAAFAGLSDYFDANHGGN